jgi:hypothetical protein
VRPAAAVVGLLCALAVLVWSPGGGPVGRVGHDPRLATPATDVLRHAGGTLWWVDRNCRVELLRLRSGARVGAGGHCHVWPAPSGQLALASRDASQPPSPPGNLQLLAQGLHSAGVIGVRADAVQPGVAWARSSLLAAVCVRRGGQEAVVQMKFSAPAGIAAPEQHVGDPLTGRCQPAFTLGSQFATSDGRHVFLDGRRLPLDHQLMRLAGGGPLDVAVTALAASPAGLVLSVTRRGPDSDGQALLVTVRSDNQVIRVDRPPRGLIDAIGVSPDGAWLSVEYAISGDVRLIPMYAANRPAAVPAVTRGLAFSPDARYIAVALPGELRIIEMGTGSSTSITDVDPVSVSWTR